jgi:hypothetical protein
MMLTSRPKIKSPFRETGSEIRLASHDYQLRNLTNFEAKNRDGLENKDAIFPTASSLLSDHFPIMWKHVRVIPTLKLGKDPTFQSSHRPITLLYTICKKI